MGTVAMMAGVAVVLYRKYPMASAGRFTSRSVALASGTILSLMLNIALFAASRAGTGALNGHPGGILYLCVASLWFISLLSIIIHGINSWHLIARRSYAELLVLCLLIWVVTWLVIPGVALLLIVDGVIDLYIDDYTRLPTPEQSHFIFLGVQLILVGLCVLLMWRAGRLARRYDTPSSAPR